MAISARQVNNKRDNEGKLTGKPGTVYDVNIKYNTPEGQKSYMKRGFLTKKEASQHEAEMKIKFRDQALASVISNNGEKKLSDYMNEWLQNYGTSNLRPSTYSSYQAQIRNHIIDKFPDIVAELGGDYGNFEDYVYGLIEDMFE